MPNIEKNFQDGVNEKGFIEVRHNIKSEYNGGGRGYNIFLWIEKLV